MVRVSVSLIVAMGGAAAACALSTAATASTTMDPASEANWGSLTVLVLATFVGLGVIGRVSRLLHTPLMSLTNAISAISVVGSILITGSDFPQEIRILGAIALFASMTNIVSGFLITERMIRMFKERGESAKGEPKR
jgi:NAD(P) transhydrogenase subunit alpha